jgi:hypothetical protein
MRPTAGSVASQPQGSGAVPVVDILLVVDFHNDVISSTTTITITTRQS